MLKMIAAGVLLACGTAQGQPSSSPRLRDTGEMLLAFLPSSQAGRDAPLPWSRFFDASRQRAVSADSIPGTRALPAASNASPRAWDEANVPPAYRRTFRILMGRQAEIDRFDPLILKQAQSNGLNPRLLKAIIAAESEFRTSARSPAGALGLMQLMPRTAEFMGVPRHQLLEPEANIAAGAAYLAHLFQKAFVRYKFSGLPARASRWLVRRVIAAYNAGPRFLRHLPLCRETRLYVAKVLWYLSSDVSLLRSAR